MVYPGRSAGSRRRWRWPAASLYVPINNLCQKIVSKTKSNRRDGSANPTTGTGDFEALNLSTGKVMWDTKLPSSPFGAATVTNDLVFTTMFNGKLIALNRSTGQIVWQQQLPAGTNSPLAIDGDTLVTAASYAERRGTEGGDRRLLAVGVGRSGSGLDRNGDVGFDRYDDVVIDDRGRRRRLGGGVRRLGQGRDDGVQLDLRELPHAGGGGFDRHRRPEPRSVEAE